MYRRNLTEKMKSRYFFSFLSVYRQRLCGSTAAVDEKERLEGLSLLHPAHTVRAGDLMIEKVVQLLILRIYFELLASQDNQS